MSAQKNYFIKEGYVSNSVIKTMDNISGQVYWEKDRLIASRYYQYHVYQYAIELIKKHAITALADVGCGPGTKLTYIHKAIPNVSITGIDQAHPIEYCKTHYDFGNWVVDDFENPTVTPDIPDLGLVICSDVIEHVQNPDKLLNYIGILANNNTRILLSTPERDFTRGKDIMNCPQSQHIREWNKEELKAYVESQGYVVEEHFCLPAFKLTLNKNFIRQEITRTLNGLPKLNNQVLVMKKR